MPLPGVPSAGTFPFCRSSFSPTVHPCRRPASVPSAGVSSLPCHRPALSPSAAAPPFRRRFIRAAGRLFPLLLPPLLFAAGSSAQPAGSRAIGRSFSLLPPPLLFAAGSSAPPAGSVPAAGVPPPPRRRMALFLPKCPVAKCQSAVPRRDPAILLTIWQRSPIGTTFVCFMASPVKELAGKMKTNN